MMVLIEVDDPADVGKNEKQRMLVYNLKKSKFTFDSYQVYSFRGINVHPATPESNEVRI